MTHAMVTELYIVYVWVKNIHYGVQAYILIPVVNFSLDI